MRPYFAWLQTKLIKEISKNSTDEDGTIKVVLMDEEGNFQKDKIVSYFC